MAITLLRKGKRGRKTSAYQAAVWVKGVQVATRTFDSKAAALAWHDQTKKEHLLRVSNPGLAYSVGVIVERYYETAFKKLRLSAQQSREPRFRYLLDGPLSGVAMGELTPAHIDAWLVWLKGHATAKNKARKSFTHELKLLRVIFNWYRNDIDYRFQSPIVKRHFQDIEYKEVAPRQQDYYISPEDVALWLRALAKRPDPVYARMAILMVHTGLRLGEAAGLCWDAIEIDASKGCSRIRVVRTLSWDYRTKAPYFQEQTKTSSSVRTVALGGVVLEMLRQLKNEVQPLPSDPVFKNAKGRLPSDNSIRANFNGAFRAAGLKWSGTHIARHTFATLALMSEGSVASVQAALGHQSEQITAKYAKVVALQGAPLFEGVARLIGLEKADD